MIKFSRILSHENDQIKTSKKKQAYIKLLSAGLITQVFEGSNRPAERNRDLAEGSQLRLEAHPTSGFQSRQERFVLNPSLRPEPRPFPATFAEFDCETLPKAAEALR